MAADGDVIALLEKRHGMPTVIRLTDGRILPVKNIAYGYDGGSEYAHVATNMRPAESAIEAALFFTNEIEEILDPATSASLWSRGTA
jgi:hypothetical protein